MALGMTAIWLKPELRLVGTTGSNRCKAEVACGMPLSAECSLRSRSADLRLFCAEQQSSIGRSR